MEEKQLFRKRDLLSFASVFLLAFAFLFLSVVSLSAQEYRATVSGVITDPSGAVLPGTQVIITNVERNVEYKSVTNDEGVYVIPFLNPGKYTLTAELSGFKKFIRTDIELKVSDKLRMDVRMELGGISETVNVSGQTATVETDTASRGNIIARKEIANLPTSGRNPFQLAWLTPGVQKTGTWRYLRPLDIGGASGMSINGGRSSENEALLDGMTTVRPGRSISLVPTMDAVQEFKVQTNTYDAQYGRSGGGVINISLKSGTNTYHGNAFFDEQASIFNANTWELNKATNRLDKDGKAIRPSAKIHTFGTQLDGPIIKDKLFLMVSYEGIRQGTADPGVVTMPISAIRGGNFQSLLNSSGQQVIIYDPMTTRVVDGKYVRDAFANNTIPANRIDPVSTKMAPYYPLPNSAGTGSAQTNNYTYPSRWIQHWDSYIGRLDWAINANNNMYIRYGHNLLHEMRSFVWGTNAAEPSGNAPLVRGDTSGAIDWTSTLNPTTIFNVRLGMLKWHNRSGSMGTGIDLSTLGYSSSLIAQLVKPSHFPQINMDDYKEFGASRPEELNPDYTYSTQANLTKLWNKHTIKTGTEIRVYRANSIALGTTSGSYTFKHLMTGSDPVTANKTSGNSWASFLLGYPTSGSVTIADTYARQNLYYVFYFQDDWKVNRKLTLNLGLRWDYETPITERFNRQTRGFAFGQAAPISATGLNLTGGLLFAGTDGKDRMAFNPDRNNWQPRIGVAYMLNDKTVIRGGYGLYYMGQSASGGTEGYSVSTPIIASSTTGIPAATLSNPFPSTLLKPTQNKLGTSTYLGLGISFNYLDRVIPLAHTYSFDIERQLPWNMVINLGYIGNNTRHLPISAGLNYVPTAELGKASTYYTEKVSNPMAGKLPNNASLNGATIERRYLMYAYPQYSGVTMNNVSIGKSDYNGFQTRLVKRFSEKFSLTTSYSISKTLEQINLLNAQDFNLADPSSSKLERRIANELDSPQRFTLGTVWSLPFGKGQAVLSDAPGWLDQVIGGWQWSGMVEFFSGYIIQHPEGPKTSEASAKLSAGERTLDRWYNGSIFKAPTAYTLRNYPTMFPDVRNPNRFDFGFNMQKYFRLTERLKLQYRCDVINAMNHPQFFGALTTSPTSSQLGGLKTSQANLPRTIHMQLRLEF